MAKQTYAILTITGSADTAATANSTVLRDVNGVATNAGEIINGNLFTQTENIQVNAVSSSKTLDGTGGIWLSTGTITLTLPAVASVGNGRIYRVFKTDAGTTVTVNTSDASTINGSASTTLTTQYTTWMFVTDGVNWFKYA